MDKLSLERFNYILQKTMDSLTADEISFLRARRDSLSAMQKDFYKSILEPKQENTKTKIEDTTEETETVKKK